MTFVYFARKKLILKKVKINTNLNNPFRYVKCVHSVAHIWYKGRISDPHPLPPWTTDFEEKCSCEEYLDFWKKYTLKKLGNIFHPYREMFHGKILPVRKNWFRFFFICKWNVKVLLKFYQELLSFFKFFSNEFYLFL